MADPRYNPQQFPNYGMTRGAPMPMVMQAPAMNGVPSYQPYNQQMMMMPGMRFPSPGMRMGPPNTPPPPYSSHIPTQCVRPRASLEKTKGSHQMSEKERAFEMQRQKLKQFGKPGTTKLDADALIGSMFTSDVKKPPEKTNAAPVEKLIDEDDSFGDFLQGPSVTSDPTSSTVDETVSAATVDEGVDQNSNPQPTQPEPEKKDLNSMMMEFSDLNAPKKARGFHKPTLNEVTKHAGQRSLKHGASVHHDSDHARSWKQQCDDLSGLFQLPAPTPPVQPVAATTPTCIQHAPAVGHDTSHIPATLYPGQVPPQQQIQHPTTATSPTLPQWCSYSEDQLPSVYKQIWEASLVNHQISTERLYPILLLSGLPREKLADIWSVCNTATPGQLVKHELWAVLAMIALTQNNFDTSTVDILSRCPEPPVPVFVAAQGTPAPSPGPEQPRPQTQTQHVVANKEEDDFADFQTASAPTHNTASNSHTSPSFEEDEYTDGRDSLSQVSTSEQSENEDIRNFESYVEEFNQNSQRLDASPLHCPFPTLQQQAQLPRDENGSVHPSSLHPPDSNRTGAVGSTGVPPTHLTWQRNNNNHAPPPFPAIPGPGNCGISTSMLSHILPPVPMGITPDGDINDDDFADFKSATPSSVINIPSNAAQPCEPVQEVSLIKDEDKYDALRFFNLQDNEEPPTQATEVVSSQTHALSTNTGVAVGDHNTPPSLDVEDDWADFAAAPSSTQSFDTSSSQLGATSSSTGGNATSKEAILTLFNSAPDIKPVALGDSVFDSAAPTSSSLGFDNMKVSSSDKENFEMAHIGGTDLFTSPGLDFTHNSSSAGFPSDNNLTTQGGLVNAIPTSSTAESIAEDWGKFSATGSSSIANPMDSIQFPAPSAGQDNITSNDDWGDFSTMGNPTTCVNDLGGVSFPAFPGVPPTQKGDECVGDSDTDWCNFEKAPVVSDGASSAGADNFVTIKKQNLGTSEIMGLFKVRDDPTTLSSYQLPQQPVGKVKPSKPQPSMEDDLGPPPMDFGGDDDDDEMTFSRGYDLDDVMQRQAPTTTYSMFGVSMSGPTYTQARSAKKVKETQEESGSVHSLELRPNNDDNQSISDSRSVSSGDLNSVDTSFNTTNVADGIPNSRSSNSLDFHATFEGEADSAYKKDVPTKAQTTHHPIKPHELLDSTPDFADKYNIDHEAQGNDRYGHEWTRCLVSCCESIAEANTLFNTISSSAVCNEVLKSNQGSQYIASIVEVYRVVCRVMTSMRSTAISTTELEQTLKNIDLAWNNLTAFLVGASLLPDPSSMVFDKCVLNSELEHVKSLACGICLLNVDATPPKMSNPSLSSLSMSGASKLVYAGRQYHSTCANFWVNQVDQTLPSLTLPDLL